MARPWIGPARYLFIPLVVEATSGYDPPPPDYETFIQHRVFFDPDPVTGDDRSIVSYFSAVSYGRAAVDATVASPVTLTNLTTEMNPTSLAIEAHPDAHLFEYIAVVYPPNQRGAGGGMAAPGRFDFDPSREPNRTKGRCRFLWNDPVGTWAMEMIHITTGLGDFYNSAEARLGAFEEMDRAGATHLSTYSKLELGWLDPSSVPIHSGAGSYTLQAISLNPASTTRVAGIKVQAKGSSRSLFIEARTRSDRWDRGFSPRDPSDPTSYEGSVGIPSEGVVVYEFAPEDDPWPRTASDPNGPWPPLQLRTPTALTVGQTFTHHDSHTMGDGTLDHRSGVGRNRELTVASTVPGGFVVRIEIDDVPIELAPDEAGGPAVTSDGPHPLDVFVRGKHGHELVHRFFDGRTWSGWINLGGGLAAGPAVTAGGPHELDVFVRGKHGDELVHRFLDGGTWSGWINLGGDLASAPAVTSGGPHVLDVFVRGKHGHELVHRFFDGGKWSGWINLGGDLAAGPTVTAGGPHELDVFVRGKHGDELVHRFFDGGKWSGWINLGGDLA